MEFGVMLPTFGEDATPESIRQMATTADAGGFDAVWAGDHVTFPATVPNTYPFSSDGTPPSVFAPDANVYDVFIVLSHLAAITDTVTLGSNVCIAPYRHPVALAKLALTLDLLSDHRFEFGVGAGWLETEFEVLDIPFDERGSRTTEFLELFSRICESGILSFDGPHHSFQETGFHPLPPDQPPLWIGGGSEATYERVGTYGTGWTTLWKRPDDIVPIRDRIQSYWDTNNRDGTPEIAVWRPVHIDEDTTLDMSRPLIGPPSKVRADIEAYAAAGVTRIIVDFYDDTLDARLTQLDRVSTHLIDSP